MLPTHSINSQWLYAFHTLSNVLFSGNNGKHSQSVHITDRVCTQRKTIIYLTPWKLNQHCCNVCKIFDFDCNVLEMGNAKVVFRPSSGLHFLKGVMWSWSGEGNAFGGGLAHLGRRYCVWGVVCLLNESCSLREGEGHIWWVKVMLDEGEEECILIHESWD